ncbi:uncharacterized protein LOC141809969 [Halichoeres trimaculatus]|uniref:uncharacterized protein LOC141809969 n=1 Tax=Halichoeres trimaculatus TaxID=147232 RepID=UPI003D9DD448
MGSSWLVLVMVAAIFISMVLLAIVCLDCRIKHPPASISQAATSDYDMSSFRVIHSFQPSIVTPHSSTLSPHSVNPGRRQPSFIATETESNPSYENPVEGPDYINTESDQEEAGYIIVLPDGEAPVNNQSRASTPSSDVQNDYVNFPKSPKGEEGLECEDRDYLNVELPDFQRSTPDLSAQSRSSRSSSSSSSSSDSEGNYVNQPPMLHSA